MVFEKFKALFKKKEQESEIDLFLKGKQPVPIVEAKTKDFCEKCNEKTFGKILCEKCQRYVDYIEQRKVAEELAKEELKRRAWVKTRDAFLEDETW